MKPESDSFATFASSIRFGSASRFQDIQCQRKTSNFGPLLIIFIALLALGVGRTMPWALGIPLIDDNVKSKSMPLYLGKEHSFGFFDALTRLKDRFSDDIVHSDSRTHLRIPHWQRSE